MTTFPFFCDYSTISFKSCQVLFCHALQSFSNLFGPAFCDYHFSLAAPNPLKIGILQKSFRNRGWIKLHGSYGWKSSDEPNKLVIGRNKERQIANEPLLSWYFNLFKQALFQQERKLLIIGYGFGDDHINEVLVEAIERYGLKLYILSPTDPSVFKNELCKAAQVYGSIIFEGLTGYIRASFKDLFPPDGNDTDSWRELEEIFFID